MFTIFDLMRAGPGAGMDAVARQFGLTQDQAQRATEALLPAFMIGLQRSAANPNAFANLMGAMTPGAPQSAAPGNQAPGQLFGPPELTRQIAEQAAHWSGVSAQVMQQMMPIVAGAVIGGLSKFSEVMRAQAASPPPSAGPAGTATAAAAAAQPYAAWAEMMQGLLGGAAAKPAEPEREPETGAPNPFHQWAELMRAMSGQGAAAPAPPPEPPKPEAAKPEGEKTSGGETLQSAWSDAIKTGREAQEQYLASLQNIFDKFWGAPPGRG